MSRRFVFLLCPILSGVSVRKLSPTSQIDNNLMMGGWGIGVMITMIAMMLMISIMHIPTLVETTGGSGITTAPRRFTSPLPCSFSVSLVRFTFRQC